MQYFVFGCVLFCGVALGSFLLWIGQWVMKKSPLLSGPVFIPTKDTDLEKMIILANTKKGDVVADLGSGDGKVVIALAQRGIEAHGYENSPSLVWLSRRKIKQLGLQKKARIHWQGFETADLTKYDVVMMYTSKMTMERMEKRIQQQLKPGARVVSNTFQFPDWKPTKVSDHIFLYSILAN